MPLYYICFLSTFQEAIEVNCIFIIIILRPDTVYHFENDNIHSFAHNLI